MKINWSKVPPAIRVDENLFPELVMMGETEGGWQDRILIDLFRDRVELQKYLSFPNSIITFVIPIDVLKQIVIKHNELEV